MMAWVKDSPKWVNQRTLSIEYRFHSSMQCSLGIGANLNKWKPWSARLEMCQWRRETLDKESIWDEARSTSLSRW